MTWDASLGGGIGIDTVLDETGLVELTRQWDDELYCAWHGRIAKAAIVATVVVTVMAPIGSCRVSVDGEATAHSVVQAYE